MSALFLILLLFFCVVDVAHPQMVAHDAAIGCEAFAVWENAWGTPRYWFLHCPDDARLQVQADGDFVRRRPRP